MASNRNKIIIQISIVFVLYFSFYAALSLGGQYRPRPTGNLRMNNGSGLAYMDATVWEPRWIVFYRWRSGSGEMITEANTLGYAFFPLVYLDRWLFHPTMKLDT